MIFGIKKKIYNSDLYSAFLAIAKNISNNKYKLFVDKYISAWCCCPGSHILQFKIFIINCDLLFTFMHLADTFIQSDMDSIQAIHLYCQYVCSLGIEHTTFALLTQCSTTEPQEHWLIIFSNIICIILY